MRFQAPIRSLIRELRIWPELLRRRLAFYWRYGEQDGLAFPLLIAVPVVAIGGILLFAYNERPQVGPAGIQAVYRAEDRARRRENDLQCLAENIYFESRGEPVDGQYAVAEVTLNRTRAQNFPHTICGVVHQARWDATRQRLVADFSWTQLAAQAAPTGPAWKQALSIANAAYDDLREPLVPDALFYHATSVRPGWAKAHKVVATIGNHIFYR